MIDGPGSPGPGGTPWQDATVTDVWVETHRAKTFRLSLTKPSPRLAGQHYVVRLTAPDGYRTQRSYSVASAPDDHGDIELTVERLAHGEVSAFLHDVVEVGDELEVRGPIGGYFVWTAGPALLVGGGSGIVPLMSMLRLARSTERSDQIRLVQSVRSPAELFYATELPGPEVTIAYSREAPPEATRAAGRIGADDLEPLLRDDQVAYVCGSANFAGAASQLLVDLGLPAARIRVERFGPTG